MHTGLASRTAAFGGLILTPLAAADIDFVTVGAPGNRATQQSDCPNGVFYAPRGAVSHEYGISRTEITSRQWFEFVQAYAPYYIGNPFDLRFTGSNIYYNPNTHGYELDESSAEWPTDVSWRMAARMCNWLHNGKVNQAWAFESGAYDTSTFGFQNGRMTDQITRSPGARFWIPSLDEWIKAVYYDPNKFGPGQGGFWQYPNGSDLPPVPGVTTDAWTGGTLGFPGPVGEFPNAQSPWGLLDTSGSVSEWTEGVDATPDSRIIRGSAAGQFGFEGSDRIDDLANEYHSPDLGRYGIRLATIPSPASVMLLPLGWAWGSLRRRR